MAFRWGTMSKDMLRLMVRISEKGPVKAHTLGNADMTRIRALFNRGFVEEKGNYYVLTEDGKTYVGEGPS